MSIYKNSLANVLFSKTKQKVLATLFGHCDRDFYTNEIIRQTNIGTGTIQRELEKLVNSGLVNVEQVGNQKRYQANRNSPIFDELRSIVIKTFGLADTIALALQSFQDKIKIAFIYGSIAKQSDTARSDVDIMIIGADLTYAEFFTVFEKIEAEIKRKINPTFYTKEEWQKKLKQNNHFVKTILTEQKIFLIGTEDELRKLG